MALLPDVTLAGGIALAVFLLTLGVLVVFVESVSRRFVVLLIMAALVVALLLAFVGEIGIGLIGLGLAAAFLANDVFEWLTTR